MRLEHVSKYKCLECVLDESGTNEAESRRKVTSRRRASGVIRSLVNVRHLQLECARVLHANCKEKERSRIGAVQMDNPKGSLGIRRMDRIPNARIRKLCRMT